MQKLRLVRILTFYKESIPNTSVSYFGPLNLKVNPNSLNITFNKAIINKTKMTSASFKVTTTIWLESLVRTLTIILYQTVQLSRAQVKEQLMTIYQLISSHQSVRTLTHHCHQRTIVTKLGVPLRLKLPIWQMVRSKPIVWYRTITIGRTFPP